MMLAMMNELRAPFFKITAVLNGGARREMAGAVGTYCRSPTELLYWQIGSRDNPLAIGLRSTMNIHVGTVG
jgi:hypothetical protein